MLSFVFFDRRRVNSGTGFAAQDFPGWSAELSQWGSGIYLISVSPISRLLYSQWPCIDSTCGLWQAVLGSMAHLPKSAERRSMHSYIHTFCRLVNRHCQHSFRKLENAYKCMLFELQRKYYHECNILCSVTLSFVLILKIVQMDCSGKTSSGEA